MASRLILNPDQAARNPRRPYELFINRLLHPYAYRSNLKLRPPRPVTVRAINEKTHPDQIAQSLAELADEVAELSRRLRSVESDHEQRAAAQQSDLTIICHDDEPNSIEFHTQNGFVIVRPWEAKGDMPASGAFRFRVQDPDGLEREINVAIATQLRSETEFRTRGRIGTSSRFWICCAERRLANYLMERDEFPPTNEMNIDTLDREDLLLAIRWGKDT